jgi:choline-sulfatase
LDNRPNIVMIMADQMAYDVIGALGHSAVKTPNIDRLVNSGVTFNNCYCNSPICVPSRASMVTSKLPSNIEVYDNGSELRSSIPTFIHHLRRSGYETILSGKMHFIGPDQLHGFEHRLTKDIHTTGFELTPEWSRGVYANPGTGIKRLKNPGECDTNTQLLHDEKNAYRTIEKIRMLGREKKNTPFFLCTSFAQPHDAFVTTKEYWDLYKDLEVPMPAAKSEPLEDMHPYNQWIQVHHEVDQCTLSEEEIRNNRRAYYGMVTYIDDKVGEIIHELERMKLLDNTLIMLTSDHGEMLGEHGMWFKRTFYDPAVKVPLIMSWPGKLPAGKAIDDVVSLIDIGPTIMSLADVPDRDTWISEMDGESFDCLLFGQHLVWKDEAVIEYYGEGSIRPMVALRKGQFKFVHIHNCEPLMFDLVNDPHEMKNIVDDPEFESYRTQFEARIFKEFDLGQMAKRILQSQKERLLVKESLQTGEQTKWDHFSQI